MTYHNILYRIGVGAVALALLAGCSADEPVLRLTPLEQESDVAQVSELWLSFDYSSGGGAHNYAVADRPSRSQTRDEATDKGEDYEQEVNSLLVWLTDGSGNVVAAGSEIAQGPEAAETVGDKHAIIKLAVCNVAKNSSYNVHLLANVPDDYVIAVYGAALSKSPLAGDFSYNYEGVVTPGNHGQMLPEGFPMAHISTMAASTSDADSYPFTDPLVVNGTFELRRLHARLDYLYGSNGNIYPVREVTDGEAKYAARVQIEPVDITPYNLMPRANFFSGSASLKDDESLLLPKAVWPTYTASLAGNLQGGSTGSKIVAYLSENLLTEDSQHTGFYLTAKLTGTDADGELKNILSKDSGTLYYYDDGKYQSLPQKLTEAPSGSNWHSISWNDGVGGYTVTYAIAITGDGTNYKIERNCIYQVQVNNVYRLPSSNGNQTLPELDIVVKTPSAWQYHYFLEEI